MKPLDCTKCIHCVVCEYANNSHKTLFQCLYFKPKSRFVELPCEVGQTVYTSVFMRGWYFRQKDKPYTAKIVFIGLNSSEEMGGGFFNVLYEKNDYMFSFRFADIGKTVFLTREEAEKALKERERK